MKLLKGNILLCLGMFLLSGLYSHAQDETEGIEFTMNLSKEELGINERLRVDFTMNKDGDNFKPPQFDGFNVIMGPSQSISSSWVNGKRSYSKTYTYILKPTARGNFTINQATIEIDGQTYKTTPQKVEVTAAVDKPNSEKTVDDVADESLHLVAEVSDASPYLNEGITVVYKLYVSPRISVSNFREVDSPKFSDFWSQNIEIRELRPEMGNIRESLIAM